MRLLNAHDYHLQSFSKAEIRSYAILSHRWGDGEIELKHIEQHTFKDCEAFPMLRGACKQALHDGFDWIWIDICCINKLGCRNQSTRCTSGTRTRPRVTSI